MRGEQGDDLTRSVQEAEVEKLRRVGQALKEKLDETAEKRVMDRQRAQQEEEAALKAIEMEVFIEPVGVQLCDLLS